jgi:hypothetical protein
MGDFFGGTLVQSADNGLHSGSLNPEPLGLASSALTTRPLLAGIFEKKQLSSLILVGG